MKERLSKKDITRLFALLNDELKADNIQGELYLVGGAVMCLVYDARASTHDVDALFKPPTKIRQAAERVSIKANVHKNWLNDGVKGFFSDTAAFNTFYELSYLTVMCAQADYLLAMKCLAMRLGEEFHDLDDVRYLIRNIGINSYEDALEIICRFYPKDRFPQKTLYALEELLEQ